jgi:hypothetical protein
MFAGNRASAVARSSSPSPPRLVTITIPASAGGIPPKWLSYPGPPRANVLLPAGYDPHKRYPLLVLLNGLANNYASYAQDGIVAMGVVPPRRHRRHARRRQRLVRRLVERRPAR